MENKKPFLQSLKEKLFGKKTINLNSIHKKHSSLFKKQNFSDIEKKIKVASSITEAIRLSALNKKVDDLIKESIHSEQEIHENALNESKKFNELHKMNLLETEKKLLMLSSNSKELKSVAVELKKHVIVTDFDRINSLVKEKQKISLNEVAKKLKLIPIRVAECANVLEKAGLIEIEYPALGAPKLIIKGFKEKEQELKKQLKENKNKKK
jgi:hypothetical protein